MNNNYSEKQLSEKITGKLSRYFGVMIKEASNEQIFRAVVMTVKDLLLEKRKAFSQKQREQKSKKLYYLCMEFLVGKSLKNNCYNLGIIKQLSEILSEYNIKLEDLYEMENDAGLGNGGLGRLAACYLEALATANYSATGFCILYEYGLFKQKLNDGWQTELPDNWLITGEAWLTHRTDRRFTVKLGGNIEENWTENKLEIKHHNYSEIEAEPYDMMISGADCEAVSVLRLWKPAAAKNFDFQSFSQGDYVSAMRQENEADLIGKVLYPADTTWEGKALRLRQQYFFVSASLQNILYDHIKRIGSIETLPDNAVIHLNDTHPALAVPELMRLLMDEHNLSWEKAWDITVNTTAYTNHTVLSEALEVWNYELMERQLPRICSIIREIDRRYTQSVNESGINCNIKNISIIENNNVKMANLSIIGSHIVNGVSQLHSDIIKKSIFKSFYQLTPEKFTNVTNGITQRKWLNQSNNTLSSFIFDLIGDDCHNQPLKLGELRNFADDKEVLTQLAEIKLKNKKRFAEFAHKRGVIIDPETIFDVQAKRIHEYKRQLMNALKIISLYDDLLVNPQTKLPPTTFIFGGKAAPNYYMAKQIIKLIWCLSQDIKKNKKINKFLNVEFLEDYNVTTAEILIPAAEISQQISLAGKEASGTGNMKFMLNGALTLGTLDGANVEMAKACGMENIYIFGLKSDEVESLWKSGYNSTYYYNHSQRLKRVISMLNSGFNGVSFSEISAYLLTGKGVADPYMCMADFSEYFTAHERAAEDYKDKIKWNKMSLINIASAGRFSADLSIQKYANDIWKMSPVL